jgi:hypothetical protein
MRLIMTPDVRKHNAGTIGLLDYGLSIPPKSDKYHFEFECHGDVLQRMLSKDLPKQSSEVIKEQKEDGVTFFATHLHSHSTGSQLWVDHKRDDAVIGTFGKNMNYKGYGPSQSYQFYKTAASKSPFLRLFSWVMLGVVRMEMLCAQ